MDVRNMAEGPQEYKLCLKEVIKESAQKGNLALLETLESQFKEANARFAELVPYIH